MPNANLWTAQTNGSFVYWPAAMQIGGWVKPENGKFRAITHNYNEGVTMPPPEPSELFDTLEEAQDWMEGLWGAVRRKFGLQ